MKVKLLQPYSLNLEKTVVAGAELEVVKSWCSCSGEQYQCIMPDGTQRVLYGSMLEVIDETPYIDWEQRRFELTKAAMQGMMAAISPERFTVRISEEAVAEASVKYADAVIYVLKNTNVGDCFTPASLKEKIQEIRDLKLNSI